MIRFFVTVLLVAAFAAGGQTFAAERAIIVLDASGSMWGQIGGKTKIEIARQTLGGVLQSVPGDLELGLIAYGHRAKGRCDDIELIVPAGPGTAGQIAEAANRLNPKGKTPLAASVKQAAEALRYTEDKATVIMITDGLETCNADPCALATELENAGVDFTAHVVGFGLSEDEGRQVACLAQNTGGKYIQAKDAGELGGALAETVAEVAAPAPEPEPEPAALAVNLKAIAVLAEGGPEVGERDDLRWDIWGLDGAGKKSKSSKTSYDNTLQALYEPGRYVIGARLGNATVEVEAELKADELTELTVNLNATRLIVHGRRSAGAETDKDIRWDVTLPNRRTTTAYGGDARFVIPAGSRKVTGKLGKAAVEDVLELVAGETVEKDYIIATGRLVAHAVYAEGGPTVEGDIRFDVLGATKDIAGRRKDFGTNYGDGAKFDLPPGDYVLKARVGKAIAEMPIAIEPDALTEPAVNVNAGILAITAPGGDRIDILGATKDIAGKSKDFGTNYGEGWQIALPEGDYVIKVRKKDKSVVEGAASVSAGQRTEVTVE
jgi:Ca-activated chloride channel family protein